MVDAETAVQERDARIENHRAETAALDTLLDERSQMGQEDQATLDELMAEHRKEGADIAAKLFDRNRERLLASNDAIQRTRELGSDDK